jgi:hypothetical protein
VRLLRLEGDGLGGRAIDLHPEISVLTDLDDDLRRRLIEACQALPRGGDPGCDGLIEAHGVLFDLGTESLDLLGLDQPLDVLVAPERPAGDPADDGRSAIEIMEGAAAELRVLRGDLDRGHLDILAALQDAREALDPFARTACDQAQLEADRGAGLTEIQRMLEDLEDPEPLEERLAEIERVDRELAEIDRDSIIAAFDVTAAAEPEDPEAVEAGRLAVELRQIDTELADLDEVLEAQGMHPLELARRRDEASVEVARLEAEQAPPDIDSDDGEELEAVHDEVMAAQAKVGSALLGGRNAERRLEEAVEAEATVLDRIGLPTYSAYVMAVTVGSADTRLDDVLHEARRELAAGQSAYESATEALEHDPVRTTLNVRREEIGARAVELVDRDPGSDVVRELLAFKKRRDEASPVDELRHRLERAGLVVPGLGLDDGEVRDFAAAWIEETAVALDLVEHRASEATDLRARVAEVERGREEIETRRAEADHVEPPVELVEARERLDRHEQATARVADLTGVLQEVDQRRHEIDARLEAQEAVAELARSGAADPSSTEAVVQTDAVLTVLKARLAEHRDRSFAGAVPMVVADLFGGFGRDTVGDLLDEVADEAAGVQILILDDELPVATWATSVGFERAAVVAPE